MHYVHVYVSTCVQSMKDAHAPSTSPATLYKTQNIFINYLHVYVSSLQHLLNKTKVKSNEESVEGLHSHPTNVPGGAWAQESNLRQGGREAYPRGSCQSLKTDTAYMQQARQEP